MSFHKVEDFYRSGYAVNADGLIREPVVLEEDADTRITISYLGNGTWRARIPDGTDHSGGDQRSGRTFKWPMRSFVTGREIDLSDLRGNLEWGLEWVSDPAAVGGGVEIAFGHCGAGDGANMMAAGIAARSTPLAVSYRVSGGSLSAYEASAPSGNVRRVRVSTDLQQSDGGAYPGNSTGISLDVSEAVLAGGESFLVPGFLPVGQYVGINVYCPSPLTMPVVVDVRPRYWAHRAV